MIMIQTYIYVKEKSHTEVLAVAPWNVVGISSCKSFSEKEWFKSGSAMVFPDELTSAYKKGTPKSNVRTGNIQNKPHLLILCWTYFNC